MARPGVRERDAWVFILPFLLIFFIYSVAFAAECLAGIP